MVGAMGSALEWALALLQAPGERHALRQKPLPPGMEPLLGIAAGTMPEALAEASRRLGEPEDRIREAARFYAREVLFHPQADAYRMLGVEADASVERIKNHHRLLQLWLHPDRHNGEDDAVFATRVNAAWNRLRTPDRRLAYDEALRRQRPPEIFDSSGALRSVRAWIPEEEARIEPSPWRRRMPVLVLLGLCGVLALLALQDVDHPAVQWEEDAPPAAVTDVVRQAPDPLSLAAKAPAPSPEVMRPAAARLAPVSPRATADALDARMPAAAVARARVPAGAPSAPSHTDLAEPSSAHVAPTLTVGDEAACGAVACSGELGPEQAPRQPAAPSFARIQSARQAGDQLLRYMRSPHMAAPPIWSSPAVEASADRLRRQLNDEGRVRLAEGRWRIGGQEAELTSELTLRGETVSAGWLTASLQWRDGYWLVTGLNMERRQ